MKPWEKTVDTAVMYRTLFRPPMFGALPSGLWWEWARVPADMAHVFPDKPVSAHPFGEFHAERRLTAGELEAFQVEVTEGTA